MTVFDEIQQERGRQDAKWGGPAHDDQHSVPDWFDLIGERADDPSAGDRRTALIKIAALAVAGIESIDRKAQRAKEQQMGQYKLWICGDDEPTEEQTDFLFGVASSELFIYAADVGDGAVLTCPSNQISPDEALLQLKGMAFDDGYRREDIRMAFLNADGTVQTFNF